MRIGANQTVQIWVVDASGSQLMQLTNRAGYQEFPQWSLDGSLIAFSRLYQGKTAIFVMDADGNEGVRVTRFGSQTAWSPDGTKMAFVRRLPDGTSSIFTMNIDGSHVDRIPQGSTHDDEPTWSPDGTKIAFHGYNEPDNPDDDVFVARADGTGSTINLTGSPNVDASPAWSPDGTKIAFESDRDGAGIFVMNPDGTGVMRVTTGFDAFPAWSPDGSKIAFERDGDIYTTNADGSGVERLADTGGTDYSPDWQPVCSVVGTSEDDTLVGTSGRDLICGLGGVDTIYGLGGNDAIFGGEGDDRVDGGYGKDVLVGGPGSDSLYGGPQSDLLSATDGLAGDKLNGAEGADTCWADAGDLLRNC